MCSSCVTRFRKVRFTMQLYNVALNTCHEEIYNVALNALREIYNNVALSALHELFWEYSV